MISLVFLSFVACSNFLIVDGYGCKDQNNNDVDWFMAYKMPRTDDNSVQGVGQGVGFYYMDVNTQSMDPSSNDISSQNQAIAYTLKQYYDNKNSGSFAHVMYNDEEPGSKDVLEIYGNRSKFAAKAEFGHLKGVVFFDQSSGFWLIHSVPKFPAADAYSYPDSGTIYAQSILCLSLDYSQLRKIGTQLYFNHPDIYSSSVPTSFASDNPDLVKVVGGQYKTGAPYTSILTLTTKGGQSFTSFAKSADFNQDLYDKLVAPTLQTSLNVETWRRGSLISLDCSARYLVLDVQEIKVENTAEFKYTHDHSKIAVSGDSSKPYVCIGDINRMTSQYVRGGGTVCLKMDFVWQIYSPFFVSTNSC